MLWPLASKPEAAGGAGDVEVTSAADAASATVKVARRMSDNSNISCGISERSPRISRKNRSITRETNESSPRISSGTSNISDRSYNNSTSGISRDISRSSPHCIQRDVVHHAFVSGMVNTDPHGPPVPSSSSSSFTEQATLAQFAPPGKLRVRSKMFVGDVTVPGSYLHSVFVVQSGNSEDDVWIADSGASCHMTHDKTRMYNARPPPPGRETIPVEDRWNTKVEYIGNMDVIFHRKTDQRSTLIDVAYGPGLGFNLYSLHAVRITYLKVSDASGTHIIGGNLTFSRSSSGLYLRATRLPAGTVGA